MNKQVVHMISYPGGVCFIKSEAVLAGGGQQQNEFGLSPFDPRAVSDG